MEVSPAGWTFLFLTNVFLPYVAIRGARRVRQPGGTPTRGQYLTSILLSQGMMLATALLAARYEFIELFPAPSFGARNVLLAVAFLVPSLGTLPWRWSWRSPEDKRRQMWRLPQRSSDLWWWLLVSLIAGTVEEIVFRGVMLQLWLRVLGSWWPAVALCTVVFALAHMVQGWRTVLVIAVMTVGMHLIVRATGDLYTAMAIHFVYDLLAGMVLLRLAKRDGLVPAAASAETASG